MRALFPGAAQKMADCCLGRVDAAQPYLHVHGFESGKERPDSQRRGRPGCQHERCAWYRGGHLSGLAPAGQGVLGVCFREDNALARRRASRRGMLAPLMHEGELRQLLSARLDEAQPGRVA